MIAAVPLMALVGLAGFLSLYLLRWAAPLPAKLGCLSTFSGGCFGSEAD